MSEGYAVYVCPLCKKQTVDDGMGTLEQDCGCNLRGKGVFPWAEITVVPAAERDALHERVAEAKEANRCLMEQVVETRERGNRLAEAARKLIQRNDADTFLTYDEIIAAEKELAAALTTWKEGDGANDAKLSQQVQPEQGAE